MPSSPKRVGFTLIEMMMVVVLIGLLTAIMIPKWAATKEKAYVASMKSDLRNLSTAEEAYFNDTFTYASDPSLLRMHTSADVVVSISEASAVGWAATSTHPRGSQSCAIFYGRVGSAPPPAAVEGEIACQ